MSSSTTRKVVTVAVAIAVIGGLAAFNATFSKGKVDASRVEASAERQEKLKLAQAGTTDQAEAAPSEKPAAPAKDTSSWPATAPDKFKLKFECSNGDFVLEINKSWAPVGVERFYEICRKASMTTRVSSGSFPGSSFNGASRATRIWRRSGGKPRSRMTR